MGERWNTLFYEFDCGPALAKSYFCFLPNPRTVLCSDQQVCSGKGEGGGGKWGWSASDGHSPATCWFAPRASIRSTHLDPRFLSSSFSLFPKLLVLGRERDFLFSDYFLWGNPFGPASRLAGLLSTIRLLLTANTSNVDFFKRWTPNVEMTRNCLLLQVCCLFRFVVSWWFYTVQHNLSLGKQRQQYRQRRGLVAMWRWLGGGCVRERGGLEVEAPLRSPGLPAGHRVGGGQRCPPEGTWHLSHHGRPGRCQSSEGNHDCGHKTARNHYIWRKKWPETIKYEYILGATWTGWGFFFLRESVSKGRIVRL